MYQMTSFDQLSYTTGSFMIPFTGRFLYEGYDDDYMSEQDPDEYDDVKMTQNRTDVRICHRPGSQPKLYINHKNICFATEYVISGNYVMWLTCDGQIGHVDTSTDNMIEHITHIHPDPSDKLIQTKLKPLSHRRHLTRLCGNKFVAFVGKMCIVLNSNGTPYMQHSFDHEGYVRCFEHNVGETIVVVWSNVIVIWDWRADMIRHTMRTVSDACTMPNIHTLIYLSRNGDDVLVTRWNSLRNQTTTMHRFANLSDDMVHNIKLSTVDSKLVIDQHDNDPNDDTRLPPYKWIYC